MNKILVADAAVVRKWWSVRIGAFGVLLMAGVPALSDQFPNLAPALLAWFPKHGQQWVPVAGALIAVAARVVSQEAVIERVRGMFRRPNDEQRHG